VSSVLALGGTIGDHAGSQRSSQPRPGITGVNTAQFLTIIHEQIIVLLSNRGCTERIFQNDCHGKTTNVMGRKQKCSFRAAMLDRNMTNR
jgi:hypothetical protein